MIDIGTLRVNDEVAALADDGLHLGNYRARENGEAVVHLKAGGGKHCKPERLYPIVSAEQLVVHDYVRPISASGRFRKAGYFHGIEDGEVILFADEFESDRPDMAMGLARSYRFAVIAGSLERGASHAA